MPSEQVPPHLDPSESPVLQQQAEEQERQLREFYRYQRRRQILRIVIAVASAIAAAAICYHVFGPDIILEWLDEFWPVLMAPLLGWLLGYWVVKNLFRPSGRLVACLYPETHLFRVVFIPDEMFKFFDQAGNNVVYHTPSGMQVYIAEDIDTSNGRIQYSWVERMSALEVMSREEFFINFKKTTEEVLRENLQLIGQPILYALGYTRRCLHDEYDHVAEVFGLRGRDFQRDESLSSPDPPEEGGQDE